MEWQTEPVPIYEYAMVSRFYETNWAAIINEPESNRPPQTWTTTCCLWEPNAKEPEQWSDDTPMLDRFNELGRRGWKLVASDIPESTVISGSSGWRGWTAGAGIPIR